MLLVGEQDFASFRSANGHAKGTIRTITALEVKEQDGEIQILVSGNGFLYNMVRIIAGTLIDVGLGEYPPQYVSEIIQGRDRSLAGPTAPAKGLTLMEIKYR
jgi:tRNA pseudouridine38-40 synthase